MNLFHTPLLSLGLLAATAVNAQPVLTYATNAPLPGQSFTRNFSSWVASGEAGANVTWDFTTLGIDSTETVQLVDPASTPFAAQFAGATVAETSGMVMNTSPLQPMGCSVRERPSMDSR